MAAITFREWPLYEGNRITVETDTLGKYGKPLDLTVIEVGEFMAILKGPRGGAFDMIEHANRTEVYLFRGRKFLGTVTSLTVKEDK